MEAALFGDVPCIGTSPRQDRDLPQAPISSSRNLPIREVPEAAWQRAQAQDMAEASTSSPRNLPIRKVSESALRKAQARSRNFILNVDAPVREMARTFPFCETSESARQTVRPHRHPILAQIKAIVDENDQWHAELDLEKQDHALELRRVTAFREQQNCDATPSSIPEYPARELDNLEEHAVMIARYSEAILTTLRTLTGTKAGASGAHEDGQAPVEGSRRADAHLFAEMSNQFFDQLMATQSRKDRFLVTVQTMLQQPSRDYDRAHAEKRRINSLLFKESTASLLLELKIGITEITTLQEWAHADLDMQLELQKELKTYQAQALEINK
jgi:hypothetical protein